MDYRRLSLGAAGPVVQKNHIVSGAGTVANGHADGRILPLVDHKLAAQLSTEGAAFFPSGFQDTVEFAQRLPIVFDMFQDVITDHHVRKIVLEGNVLHVEM